jgi:hypothetical protein
MGRARWWGLLALGACSEGRWSVETWGEEYIEEEIPAADFADGCCVVYDRFLVVFADIALEDGDGEVVAQHEPDDVFDVHLAGPHAVATLDVPADHYDAVRMRVAPSASPVGVNTDEAELLDGASVWASGTLSCPDRDPVTFDWRFETDTLYLCEPEDLTIAANGADSSQLTIHGDHLFYDGLSNPDAEVRGLAIADADADGDKDITLDELATVGVAGLGYDVGPYADVADLRAFVTFLTQTLGHIDGEGHCQVDL